MSVLVGSNYLPVLPDGTAIVSVADLQTSIIQHDVLYLSVPSLPFWGVETRLEVIIKPYLLDITSRRYHSLSKLCNYYILT